MENIKHLLNFCFFLFFFTLGNAQNETGLNLIDVMGGQENANAQANFQKLVNSGNYFIGEIWTTKIPNSNGGENKLEISFQDLENYTGRLDDKGKITTWSGKWYWTSHTYLLTLKDLQNSDLLKYNVFILDLNNFNANRTIRFTRFSNRESTNVTQQRNTNISNKVNSNTENSNSSELVGTWRFFERGQFYTNEILLNVYSDNRLFAVPKEVNFPCNGTWQIEGEFLKIIWDIPNHAPFAELNIQRKNNETILINNSTNTIANRLSITPTIIQQTNYLGANITPQKAQSSTINIEKIFGTWQEQPGKDDSYYNFYQDQRFYTSSGKNGNWTIVGDKIYFNIDNREQTIVAHSYSFSGTTWTYEFIANSNKYTAKKVSDIPIKLNITSPQQKCPKCNKSECICPTQFQIHCACCIEGYQDCNNCSDGYKTISEPDGRGGTNSRRIVCGSCSGGRVRCSCCNGTGKQ